MPTPAERQALLFVATVAALGLAVRACARFDAPAVATADDRKALAAQLGRVDSLIARGGERRRNARGRGRASTDPAVSEASSAVPAPRGPVDVDVASIAELDLLPGIGPALAARIVADREARGPFGSIEGLERVRGIGPALAERLRAHVTFSLAPRPLDTGVPAVGRGGGVRHP